MSIHGWSLRSIIMKNKEIADVLVAGYFLAVILCVASLCVFKSERLMHGHVKKGISKNLYFCFYLYAVCFHTYLSRPPNVYLVFLVRRLVECLAHRYSRKSKLSWCHFVFGFSYYTAVCLYLCDKSIPQETFLSLNAVQAVAHILVFRYGFRHIHYLAEMLIYAYIFLVLHSVHSFLVLAYVVLFATISMHMRCIIEKKEKMRSREGVAVCSHTFSQNVIDRYMPYSTDTRLKHIRVKKVFAEETVCLQASKATGRTYSNKTCFIAEKNYK